MKTNFIRRSLGAVFAILLSGVGSLLYAQATSRVTGTIQDKSGGVVVGATVTLTNQATNVAL